MQIFSHSNHCAMIEISIWWYDIRRIWWAQHDILFQFL